MAGIDLIPASYRQAYAARRILRRSAMGMGLLLAAFLVVYGGLHWRLGKEKVQLQAARLEASQIAALQKQIDELARRKSQLEHRAATLTALRGAGEFGQVGRALDASLNAGVWLSSLRYRRDREPVTPVQEKDIIKTAYALIRSSGEQKNETWNVRSSIQIRGAALDYNALSSFMQALAAQPGMADVRFLNSTVSHSESGRTIEFSASAIIVPAIRRLP